MGEVDGINIVRNSSLWSDAVFEKEVILDEIDFETSSLESESTLSLLSRKLDERLS